jgi:hypothetical protein
MARASSALADRKGLLGADLAAIRTAADQATALLPPA